jgi:hypothetical protein
MDSLANFSMHRPLCFRINTVFGITREGIDSATGHDDIIYVKAHMMRLVPQVAKFHHMIRGLEKR